jgi:hypothetical protein
MALGPACSGRASAKAGPALTPGQQRGRRLDIQLQPDSAMQHLRRRSPPPPRPLNSTQAEPDNLRTLTAVTAIPAQRAESALGAAAIQRIDSTDGSPFSFTIYRPAHRYATTQRPQFGMCVRCRCADERGLLRTYWLVAALNLATSSAGTRPRSFTLDFLRLGRLTHLSGIQRARCFPT